MDEYIVAMAHAGAYFKRLAEQPTALGFNAPASGLPSAGGRDVLRRFYVVTIDQAEELHTALSHCAISSWAITLHDRLLAHPLRTVVPSEAQVVIMPPHFGWEVRCGNHHSRDSRSSSHSHPDLNTCLPAALARDFCK